MNTGIELDKLLYQVEDDAFYFATDYPKAAEKMLKLIKIVKAYDKNQKALIQLVLRLQRANKGLDKIAKRMYMLMSRGQKNIVNIWLKEKDL